MKFELSEQKLTLKELNNFEQKYNLNLPSIYKDIMLEYNGGYPEKSYYKGREIYFEPIKYGDYHLEKVMDIPHGDFMPKVFFTFGSSSGRYLCISLDEEDENTYGMIYILDEEGNYYDICDSLEDLMEGLSEDSDY